MQTTVPKLPSNPARLRAMVRAAHADLATKDAELTRLRATLVYRDAELEKLKDQLARLKRMRFGRSSEKLEAQIHQLELRIEEIETPAPGAAPESPESAPAQGKQPAVRQRLPAHLPREAVVHAPACACPGCGGTLRSIGEDVSEILEYRPEHWKVIRHTRPKQACDRCDRVIQAPAPSRPIARSYAGPGLLAHVLVGKYCDHLPLYRQSRIYAREAIDINVSTLADWVGATSALLNPLVDALAQQVMSGAKLHADDTPVPVLAKGLGPTKTGRLWTYVRDDRPAGSASPPAVLFRYTPDRKGHRPREHLKAFKGILQADGYAGFHHLYATGDIKEAACWAHVRRKFYDSHQASASPIAEDILQRISTLYAVERAIKGAPPKQRRTVRQARAGPILDGLKHSLTHALTQVSKKSALAVAIRYALSRWPALTRYRDDGAIEIDNNAAERALRCVALGRKNYMFAGADTGGVRAANMYSLIGSALANGINPETYLRFVLERINDYPISRVAELLPWRVDLEADKELQAVD